MSLINIHKTRKGGLGWGLFPVVKFVGLALPGLLILRLDFEATRILLSRLCIYRRFSRLVQLGGLVPILVLGVPPRYKAK